MSSQIRAIDSPTHPIAIEWENASGTVRLGERNIALDRDFVLHIHTVDAELPKSLIEVNETGKKSILISVKPTFESKRAPSELIFLIDRSGSMDGSSIAEARNALLLCLRSLNEGMRFNIVGFGSTYEKLFPESQEYNDETLSAALEHVSKMKANLCGTEILEPLQAILKREPIIGMPRQLFIVTDGEVSNTDAVLQLIRKNSNTTRCFSFGIGSGPSQHLIRGMARAGGGSAEFICPGERIEPKVLRQLSNALTPAITNLTVDWGTLNVCQAPHFLPPVFAGGRLIIYGFLENNEVSDVKLHATGTFGPISFKFRVDPALAKPGDIITTLAARAMIRDLEEGMSSLHNCCGSLQNRVKKDQVKEEIIRLGVTHNLCSRETSFVAIEKQEELLKGNKQLRRIPVALTRDWGGIHGNTGRITAVNPHQPRLSPEFASTSMSYQGDMHVPAMYRTVARLNAPLEDLCLHEKMDSFHMESLLKNMEHNSYSQMSRLLSMANADGSWDIGNTMASILGTRVMYILNAMPDDQEDSAILRKIWATTLVLSWLSLHVTEFKTEWNLIAEKARNWLDNSNTTGIKQSDWDLLANNFLQTISC